MLFPAKRVIVDFAKQITLLETILGSLHKHLFKINDRETRTKPVVPFLLTFPQVFVDDLHLESLLSLSKITTRITTRKLSVTKLLESQLESF